MVNKDPRLFWLLSPSLFFTDYSLCAVIRADKTEQSLRIIQLWEKKWVRGSAGGQQSPLSHLSTTGIRPPGMNGKSNHLGHLHTHITLIGFVKVYGCLS